MNMTRTLRRFLRPLVAAGVLGAGIALAATTAASAATVTASTTLQLQVPGTLTMSGLAATYTAPAPAGTTITIATGPLTISTNNVAGYTLNVKAASATFAGSGANTVSIPAGNDKTMVTPCPTGAGCSTAQPLSTLGVDLVIQNGATAGDTFSVDHAILIPGNLPADTYSDGVVYTARTN